MKKPATMKPIGMSMPREHTSSTKAPSFTEKPPVAPKAPAAPKMPTAPVAVQAPKQMTGTTVAAPKAPKVTSRMKQINGM